MAKTARRGVSTTKKSPGHLGRGYIALAVITVAAMVIGVLAVVVEDFARSSGDKTINLNDANDEVEAALRADMEAHPDDPQAIAGLANYLSNVGKIEEAIPLYEKAISLAPDDWNLRLDFAQSLGANEKRADAELQYQKVIAAQPNLATAWFGLGMLYAAWVPPRTADAIAAFEKARTVDPQSFVAERAAEELSKLGVGTPAASPIAATPSGG